MPSQSGFKILENEHELTQIHCHLSHITNLETTLVGRLSLIIENALVGTGICL